jgi:hypothetical protein
MSTTVEARKGNPEPEPPAEHPSAGARTTWPCRAQTGSRPPQAPAQRVAAKRRVFTQASTALHVHTAPASPHAPAALCATPAVLEPNSRHWA